MIKEPPHSTDAEETIIGAIAGYSNAWPVVMASMQPEDAYLHNTIRALRYAAELDKRGERVDTVSLMERARHDGANELAVWIADCELSIPGIRGLESAIQIVKSHKVSRDMLVAGRTLGDLAYCDEPLQDRLSAAQKAVLTLGDETVTGGPEHAPCVLARTVDALDKRRHAQSMGASTGFDALNHRWGGLEKNHLIVVAGRPAMGKTTLAMNIAERVAETEQVLVFSLEMDSDDLMAKSLSSLSGVPYSALRSGSFWSRADYVVSFEEAAARIKKLNLAIDSTSGISLAQIRARSRRHAHEHGLALIVIDYIQLVGGKHPRQSFYEHVTEISRQCKQLAKELHCSVILLSQLNRETEKRPYGKNRPIMADLRDSGSIEQDADIVTFVYRDVVYNEKTDAPNAAEAITVKQRRGTPGTDYLLAELDKSRFADWTKPKPEYGTPKQGAEFDA